VAALEDLSLERGGGQLDRQAWGTLLVDATMLELASDGIERTATVRGVAHGCHAARTSLDEEGRTLAGSVDAEADRVERSGIRATAGAGTASGTAVEMGIPAALEACLAAHAHDGLTAAIGLVWVHEWLALVGDRPR
jgi:hypothetical protein